MSKVVVPVSLGGSPHRGLFCPPVREKTMLETIPALIEHYRARRGRVDEVRFFHGGTVSSKALSFCDGLDWRISVNPLDCTRAQALRYVQNGISAIELEVLSLCDDVLKRAKRGYTYAFFQQQLSFFQEHDVDVGVVLSPGIFGSSFVHCCETVERCIKLGIDFVRIYPVCVYEGTKLEQWFLQDRYEPLGLSETVTIVREMMDRLAYSGIEVIRVGRQDTHDGLSVSVAGPNHSNVRGLIENRRFFDKISAQLCAQGESITHIVVHPKDVSLAKGVQGDTIRHLRARLERDLVLTVDTRVPRGSVWTRKKDE